MTSFTFITANDIHISDSNPRSRIDNFKETILGKISQIRMACNKLGADGCLIAGDLYNIKDPAKNSHQLNQELIKEFRQFNCPIYMIEGNHDLTNNHLGSLIYQPLGVLFEDKTIIQLRNEMIEKDGNKISLVGTPYTDNIDVGTLKIPPKDDCKVQICLMHLYASPTPGMLFKERIYGYRDFQELSPDIFVFGHYHIDQGITIENGKYFVNIGSVSRGILSDEDIAHHPQIGLIKIDIENNNTSIEIKPIKLKIKQASEVFNLQKREEEIKERRDIEEFVEKLVVESGNITDEKKDINDIIKSIVDGMTLADVVKKRVMGYIEQAAASR